MRPLMSAWMETRRWAWLGSICRKLHRCTRVHECSQCRTGARSRELDAASAEVFTKLVELLGRRLAVFLDRTFCPAAGNELLIMLDDFRGVGGCVAAGGVEVVVTRELGSDVDRKPGPTASVRNTRRKSCGLKASGRPSTSHSPACLRPRLASFVPSPELIVLRRPMRKLRWNR